MQTSSTQCFNREVKVNDHQSDTTPLFSERLALIGRKNETNYFTHCLQHYNASDFFYIVSPGGMGKTRLLEEFRGIVKKQASANPEKKYRVTRILDLYLTHTHSTSEIERQIIEDLAYEPTFFVEYHKRREQYQKWREMGADPEVLETRREELSQTFVKEWNDISRKHFLKLVILIDTIELLQFENSIVEDKAGLEQVDARVKPWLLSKLPLLNNVLVVMAGRPKETTEDAARKLQEEFVQQMKDAFHESLKIFELSGLSQTEVGDFIKEMSKSETHPAIPVDLAPVIHCLTGGRPIFIHLIYDLVRRLAAQPAQILEKLRGYAGLAGQCETDEVKRAQEDIKKAILSGIFKSEKAFLLSRVGLMPKGVTPSMLTMVFGYPSEEANRLLTEELKNLSFVKRFANPEPGGEPLVFLHDEMYDLLSMPGVINDLRFHQIWVSKTLITSYYGPEIKRLEDSLVAEKDAGIKVSLRSQLQTLQVDRLYYLLVQEPTEGYKEYKRLSVEANRKRWVGWGNRLLDEFLRFYNKPYWRKLFNTKIQPETIVRESARMWMERFRWWGMAENGERFGKSILESPLTFQLGPEENTIKGIIAGLYGYLVAKRHGYNADTVRQMQEHIQLLPRDSQDDETLLARARLNYAIAFHYWEGGDLEKTANYYTQAKNTFKRLEQNKDELAITLIGLSLTVAHLGRHAEARSLVKEAYWLARELDSIYITGLALSASASIETLHGNLQDALQIAEQALKKFQDLSDNWGIALAHQKIAVALRRMGKSELELIPESMPPVLAKEEMDDALAKLNGAKTELISALKSAEDFEQLANEIKIEFGRAYRDLAHAELRIHADPGTIDDYFSNARNYLKAGVDFMRENAEQSSRINIFDVEEDRVEVLYYAGQIKDAEREQEILRAEIIKFLGEENTIAEGKPLGKYEPLKLFTPLAKLERLQGVMLFSQKRYPEGLKHFALAYAYFGRFSPEISEIERMVQFIHSRMSQLTVDEQRIYVGELRAWIGANTFGKEMDPFLVTISNLLGG
jgi:hypothetical protein